MNTQAKVHTYTEPDSSKGFKGPMTSDILLGKLWERCADTLTEDELASVAGGATDAAHKLFLLGNSVEAVGMLVAGDNNTDGIRMGALDDPSDFLYSIGHQIKALAAMVEIADCASSRLIYRSRYTGSDVLKGGAA